jgi:hypothetical protein
MTTTGVVFVIEFAHVVVGWVAWFIAFVCTVSLTRN